MRFWGWCLVLIAALCVAQPSWAQSDKRVALIIGNDNYRGLKPLDNAANDARAMERTLKSLGWETIVRTNVGRRDLYDAIDIFGGKLSSGAVGLFYYAGHGVESHGQNFLVPVDATLEKENDLKSDAVAVDEVVGAMKSASNPMNIIILDACRDNPLKGRSGARGLAVIQTPSGSSGMFVAYAAAPGEKAEDGDKGGNGVFTSELVKAMVEPGLKIEDVFKRAVAGVKSRTGGHQVPWTQASLSGDFYFRPNSAPTVAVSRPVPVPAPSPAPAPDQGALELVFWQSAEKADTLAAYEAYAKKFPRGQFIDLAKSKIEGMRAAQKSPAVEAAAVVSAPKPATLRPHEEPKPAPRAPGSVFRDAPGLPEMVVIPTGRFTMGSSSAETSREGVPDAYANWDHPKHEVSVGAFAIGKYDVTVGEYGAFVSETGYGQSGCYVYDGKAWNNDATKSWRSHGFSQSDRSPVVCVSYEDAQAYVRWLNGKVRSLSSVSTGSGDGPYRLPSEAEWEYAARAGTTTARWWGEEIGSGNAVCDGCGSQWDNKSTAPVGSFRPNPYGLYDVLGNVWQWTDDCWVENYFGAPVDGRANSSGDCGKRVVRGGSWGGYPRALRSALRYWIDSGVRNANVGFRVARTLP